MSRPGYAVTRLDYTPPSNDETGRVFIELKANAKGAIPSTTLRISAADIVGKTVGEIFALLVVFGVGSLLLVPALIWLAGHPLASD